jgi:hypothetical protein
MSGKKEKEDEMGIKSIHELARICTNESIGAGGSPMHFPAAFV